MSKRRLNKLLNGRLFQKLKDHRERPYSSQTPKDILFVAPQSDYLFKNTQVTQDTSRRFKKLKSLSTKLVTIFLKVEVTQASRENQNVCFLSKS